MKKLNILRLLSTVSIAAAGVFGITSVKDSKKVEKTEAAYNSTIRVYVDASIIGGTINFVRIGTDQESGTASLTSSNAKYNQSLGAYVRDISSSTSYTLMGCFWSENNQWSGVKWVSGGEDGYAPFDGGFLPGHEYQIKIGSWAYDNSKGKFFNYDVYHIGEITDNVQNSTFYFVDGYSWHLSKSVKAYFWGGTATSGNYPGVTMTDSKLRIKAYVGSSEISSLHIYKYTLSGSAAYVKFSDGNDNEKTGDLRLETDGIYFYGVGDVYKDVVRLLVSLKSNLGSYTYKGKSFTNSICHLTQTQAGTFVSSYDTLVASGGAIATSVPGSGIVTYDTPETSNSHEGEMSLSAVRLALINKYPAIKPTGSQALFQIFGNKNNAVIISVIIVSVVGVASIGGYFFYKKRKEN